MSATRLRADQAERVWGRDVLPAPFSIARAGARIGEIWFHDDRSEAPELLVKFLFTSARLSVQVHPDDNAARGLGLPRGKDEAWFVLTAEPEAEIGLGLTREVGADALSAAALDGSIEGLVDWRGVAAGDFFYSPGGTVHAIGAGLALVEIQQNLDLTYRLYDYGRPRELQLQAGLAVADRRPWSPANAPVAHGPGRTVLASGGAFVVERWQVDGGLWTADPGAGGVLIPLGPAGTIGGAALALGEVWAVEGPTVLAGPANLLAAYPRGAVRPQALQPGA